MSSPPSSPSKAEAAPAANPEVTHGQPVARDDAPQSQRRRSILRAAAVGGAGLLSTRVAAAQTDTAPPEIGQPEALADVVDGC
jgi:pyruvate dehydrogenase (quinone)